MTRARAATVPETMDVRRWQKHTVFFFSSRRRHTRSYGDWSSDVCSSDLDRCTRGPGGGIGEPLAVPAGRDGDQPHFRSEERRVGKECGSWWGQGHEKERIRK